MLRTLVDLLRRAASDAPSEAVIHISRDESEQAHSYAALYRDALRTLAFLQGHGLAPGRTVLLQIACERRQLELFWGALLGGMVPVILPKVGAWVRDSEAAQKLNSVCRVLQAPLIVLDADQVANYAAPGLTPAAHGVAWLADAPGQGLAALARPHQGEPDDLAFLQFSSGSTGVPKGVRLSHRNLLCNVREIAEAAALQPGERMLSWMPLFHDMGLICFHLVPLHVGMTQVKMQPAHFIADPLAWLRKIGAHRASVTGSPNFGLQHVLDKLDSAAAGALDLSSLRLLFNGAEPISPQVVRSFSARLAPHGFRAAAMCPAYGMAEACLAVTMAVSAAAPLLHRFARERLIAQGVAQPAGDGDDALEYVDCGAALPSVQLRIVGDDGAVLAPMRLGEVQIRGVNVTSGYVGGVDADRLFSADGWLRTGDLGCLCDGRLVITGRRKDVIFVNGRTVMTADLERHLAERHGLRDGAVVACGLSDAASGRERVLLFATLRGKQTDWPRLHQLRQSAQDYLAFPVDAALPARRIPRTTSGKLQRYKLAEQVRDGEFDALLAQFHQHAPAAAPEAAPADAGQRAIRAIWAAVLRREAATLPLDAAFTALGGTSVQAIEMLAKVEQHAGREYGYALLLQCRSIREVAEYLARADAAPAAAGPIAAPAPAARAGDIAIIGMAGRFPGAATLAQFWDNLCAGASFTAPVPAARWTSPRGSFHMAALADAELFAADFFGIAEDEACIMDPQQRLMLELAYEAMDNAGCNGARLDARREVGIYLGVSHNSYLEEIAVRRRRQDFSGAQHTRLMPANLLNMVAARIAHTLDTTGPALTFDSACSSSLVALHYACNDLLQDNCTLAIAGGVNLMYTAHAHEMFAQAGALSPDGVCRTFDSAANGMVPGEGGGVVVLKRLERALADGDRIDAVIAASAINNDGKSIGIMAPAPEGQEQVLRRAYARAGVSPAQVSYIEAHGTGTPLGDQIELRALTRVFGAEAGAGAGQCGIGSVKTGIGHLLAAAGVAGLLKVALALRHRQLPATLHFQSSHARLRFDASPFYPVRALTPWPAGALPRHAGVSAFGFGGTNAHAVLREGVKRRSRSPVLAVNSHSARTAIV
ncbi:hypothetical protein RugamoR64_50110 [Duganella rhizosphaerae]